MGIKKVYSYFGNVLLFGKTVMIDYSAFTQAETEEKARSNFMYQCRKRLGLMKNAKIVLTGVIKEEEPK